MQRFGSLKEQPFYQGPPTRFTRVTVFVALRVTLPRRKRRGRGSFSLNAMSPQPPLASMGWESYRGWDRDHASKDDRI